MKVSTWRKIVKQGIKNAFGNRTMSLASIVAITAALFVLGVIISVTANFNNMTNGLESKVEINLYLKNTATYNEIKDLQEEISKWPGVREVEFKSKEDGIKNWQKELGDKSELLEGYVGENNPLPDSFIIKLDKPQYSEDIVKRANNLELTLKVRYSKVVAQSITKIASIIRFVGAAVVIILACIAMVVISNTIKLTVYSRRREINIMKYIGATDWYIRWPFIIEGFTLGVTGGIMATFLVDIAYKLFLKKVVGINGGTKLLAMFELLPVNAIIGSIFAVFILVGAFTGITASVLSIRKYLKV